MELFLRNTEHPAFDNSHPASPKILVGDTNKQFYLENFKNLLGYVLQIVKISF